MGKTLQRLQNRDAAITAEMRSMSDALAAEDRTAFNEEESAKFAQLEAESKDVQRMLKVEEGILAQEKRLAKVADGNVKAHADAIAKIDSPEAESKLSPADVRIVERHCRLSNFAGPQRSAQEWREAAYLSGRFLMATAWNHGPSKLWCEKRGIQMNAMLAQSGAANNLGGILVPDVLADTIIDLKEQYGVFAQYADRWPMTSDNVTIARRNTGLTVYAVSDGVATTESTMTWDGVTLSAKEWACLARYPLTLAEDAIVSIADKLAGEMAWAFAKKEDECGFLGDGTSTYAGIRGLKVLMDDAQHGNSVTTNGSTNGGQVVAAAGGTSLGATVLTDYERVVGLLPQYAAMNAKWYFSRAAFASGPQRLMDAAGGNTNNTLASGGPGSLPGPMFLGYPVVISQVLPTNTATSSTVVAFFGDLALASCYGSRREIGIATSTERYFETRQIGIQGIERFDIVNHDLGDTSNAGPIVSLKLSAS